MNTTNESIKILHDQALSHNLSVLIAELILTTKTISIWSQIMEHTIDSANQITLGYQQILNDHLHNHFLIHFINRISQ